MRGAVEDHDKKWLQVKGCCFRRETNQVWPGACLSCRSITDFGWRCTCHSRQAMPERALLTSCSSCLTRPPTYVSFAQPDGDIVFARTFILTLTRTRARRRLSPNSPQNRRLLARRFSRAARWTHKASAEIWSSSNPQWLIFNPAIKISPPVFVGSPLSACFSVDPVPALRLFWFDMTRATAIDTGSRIQTPRNNVHGKEEPDQPAQDHQEG